MPKIYLGFGIAVGIWAAKSWVFRHCVSVVRGLAFCIKSVQSVKLSSPHSALVHISFYNEVN